MQCLWVCYTLVDSCDSNKRRCCWDHTDHKDKREKAKVMSAIKTIQGKPLSVMIQFHSENSEKARVMSAKKDNVWKATKSDDTVNAGQKRGRK